MVIYNNRIFPTSYFQLPVRPVSSISSITYLDTSDVQQTYSSANYTLNANRPLPRIDIKQSGDGVPGSLSDEKSGIVVTYVCGYSTADAAPSALVHAVKLLAAHWYDMRALQVPQSLTSVSMMLDALMGPYMMPKI